jgi:outer membrane lipoprotein SlyB
MNFRNLINASVAGAVVVLAGCATPYGYPPPGAYAAPQVEYGVVEGIDGVRGAPTSSGAGAVIGGVAGGVLGHQVGGGTGNTVATIAGAIGGAVVGNQVEKSNSAAQTGYRIRVRTDSGATLNLDGPTDQNLRVGDRVRIEGGRIYRM